MSHSYRLIETVDCSTAQEFCTAICPFGPVFSRFSRLDRWIYRGHGAADYKLIPSAFRPEGREKLFRLSAIGLEALGSKTSNAVQWLAEAVPIEHFFIRADQAGLPFPEDSQLTRRQLSRCVYSFQEWANEAQNSTDEQHMLRVGNDPTHHWIPESLLSFVAMAQHYGIPTRLLDWTHSPFVAAYFAARDALSSVADAFSVHALFGGALETGYGLRSVFNEKNLHLAIVSTPRAANPNLHAQEGVFTYLRPSASLPLLESCPFVIEDEVEGIQNPLPEYAPLLYRITVRRDEAPEVLWHLDKLGYNAARLFPGFDGAARAVDEFSKVKPLVEA